MKKKQKNNSTYFNIPTHTVTLTLRRLSKQHGLHVHARVMQSPTQMHTSIVPRPAKNYLK